MLRLSLVKTALALFAFSGLSNAETAQTYRDNTVRFVSKTDNWFAFSGSYYSLTGVSYTSGQDPDGHLRPGNTYGFAIGDRTGSMTFSVGRKGSGDVANWWKNTLGGASHSTFNHDPDNLNFAMIGTLVLYTTGGPGGGWTLSDITIGQGASGTSNNWWFGGKNCNNNGDNSVICKGTQGSRIPADFYFQRGGNSVDEIDLYNVVFHD